MCKNSVTKNNIDIMLKADSTKGDIIRPPEYKLDISYIETICKLYC